MKATIQTYLSLILFIFSLSFSLSADEPKDVKSNKTKSSIHRFLEKVKLFGKSLAPSKLDTKIKNEIANLDISTKLKLFDLDIIEGMNLSGKYRYQVEPSYEDGFYTRVDKWRMNVSVSPGDWLDLEKTMPIYLNINAGSEVVFVRQFKSQWEAAKALPITPYRLPITAERAINDLSPGMFVAIPTHLNITVGANAIAEQGVFTGKIGTYYLISGEFQLHIFRLKDNKVRLKLIAVKRRTPGLNISVKYGFSVFKIDIVDDAIERMVGTNLVKMGVSQEKGDLFLLDYMLDLNYPEVREAYNQILGSTFKFKAAKMLNPFIKDKRVDQAIITDLTKVDDLFLEDKELEQDKRRIDRIFKGRNKFSRVSSKLKIGMKLAEFKVNQTLSNSYITAFDRDDKKQNFLYLSSTRGHSGSFLFGIDKIKTRGTYHLLAKANDNGNIVLDGISDYGFSYEKKAKRLSISELKTVRKFLMANLTPKIFDTIEWDKILNLSLEQKQDINIFDGMYIPSKVWRLLKQDVQHNVRLNYQVIFSSELLKIFQKFSRKYLSKKMDQAIKKYRHDLPTSPMCKYELLKKTKYNNNAAEKQYQRLIKKQLLDVLVYSFTPAVSAKDRRKKMEEFMKIHGEQIFKRIGLSFMLSLVDDELLNKYVYFSFKWSSNEIKGLKPFTYGTNHQTELYDSLQYIQAVLDNKSFDLRLVGYDLKSETGLK